MTTRLSGALTIEGANVHCGRCGHDLGPVTGGWKAGALVTERPMNDAGGAPYKSRAHVLLRIFACPGCGRQLETETAMKGDPFLSDVVKIG